MPKSPSVAPEPVDAMSASQPRSAEAQDLIRRAPMGYVWNQFASLWLFLASFLFTILATRLGRDPYGVLAGALTIYNTAVYLAAFGLEDASSVFVPRALAEDGRAAAAAVIRRLALTRVLCLAFVAAAILAGVPLLAHLAGQIHQTWAQDLAGANHVPGLDVLAAPVAAYVFGTGLMNQFSAIFTALLRTRLTFIVNSLSQVMNLVAVFTALKLGMGVPGVLWGLAASAWLTALAYVFLLAPWWGYRSAGRPVTVPAFGPVLRLGWSAWLINIVNGALLKQVIISLFQFFLITTAVIGYFNLAFQLTHAAAYLLIAGLGGVGLAAMSAAYAGNDRPSLAVAWRAVSKVHILLSVPLLAFCFIYARSIVFVLYGAAYAPAAILMQVFLLFNIFYLLAGGNAHQAALYVLGRQRLALITQWAGLALTAGMAYVLIPRAGMFGGPDGALIAIGTGQAATVIAQLIIAWRLLHAKYPIRFSARVVLALIPPLLLAVFVHPRAWLPDHLGSVHVPITLLDLTLSVILFTIVLVIGLAIAKPIEHLDVDLLSQTNPRLRPILSPFASGAPSPMMLISKMPTRKITEKAVEEAEADKTPTARRPRVPSQPVIRMPIEIQQRLEE
jgi:O-antigen/teichoic acid export membrane protein